MKYVILMRGISGSGKSTLAADLKADKEKKGLAVAVCSADKFFMRGDDYCFDPMKLAEAHAWCFGQFLLALQEADVVIVDNTFVRRWELNNYIKLARLARAQCEIYEIRVETIDQLRVCIRRNVHRVPAEVVARTAVEFEPQDGAIVVPMK